jgi:hypothetical protein
MGTKAAWTAERKARQAETIRGTKPWEHATGPQSEAGKAISARNAYRGDWYHEAHAQLANARSGALASLGYKRMPRGIL